MNRYRNAPGMRGPSKASPTTQCQKCLQRDIYECKGTAQDRPYKPRPSRTQQLLNPKLMPKLSTENPNTLLESYVFNSAETMPTDPSIAKLTQNSNGVADGILAKRDEERGRKRDLDGQGSSGQSPKRARSLSTHSVDSISTISTNRSASRSPAPRSSRGGGDKGNSASPAASKSRKRRYSDSADSYSASSYSSGARHRSRSREWTEDRNIRRRRRESSPEQRGRKRDSEGQDPRRERRSRSAESPRAAKERRSMTPEAKQDHSSRRSYRNRENPPTQTEGGRPKQEPRGRPGPPRQRSMSPYSKRLALTQSMNVGR
ncbi:hypothetical protein N7481_002748 [Penicillium waksmanii]|uniref:uncharacterized protein n=1 Tax=Penicillium waksmanii TaxID=69791 RepID=UPI0025497A1D|nr:uncharacterized protein N7481_002748 [Penicillium waksmanii]KAJ5995771.1 hypothetical protein N7481_002748 [Penicillium waksmanii]